MNNKVWRTFIFAMLFSASAFASQNSLTVTGEASILTTPDKAQIYFSISQSSEKLEEALEWQKEQTEITIAYLKKHGINEELKSLGLTYRPVYEFKDTWKNPILLYYETKQDFIVSVPADKASSLLSELASSVHVSKVSFVVSNREELVEKVTKLAIENAQKKAKKLSSDLGISLGMIIAFNETSPEKNDTSKTSTAEQEIRAAISITYKLPE